MNARIRLLVFLLLCPLLAGLTSPPQGDADHDASAAFVFLPDELAFIDIELSAGALDSILADPWDRTYRRCSLRFRNSLLDTIVHDVGIRARGNTSLQAVKKSWKLSFNTFVPGRKFHGLEKMNLNGEHNDVSIIRARLAGELYRRMGVPSSRATHVQLKINDGARVEGLHIHVEAMDEELVQAWFGNKDSSLYKCVYLGARADLRWIWPGDPETYANLGNGETYEEKNLAVPDYSDLADFIDFLNHSDDAFFAAELGLRFSLDNFLRAMAVDAAIGHWDNYWFGANNYHLYHNTDSGRFEYLPYDLDNSYGVDFSETNWAERPLAGWGDGGYGSDPDLPPLIRRVLAVDAFRAQLRRYAREVAGGPFSLAATEAGIDAVQAMIAPYAFTGSYADSMDWGYTHAMFLESYTAPEEYRDWDWGWDYGLKPYIADRAAFLLATVPPQAPLPALRINEIQSSNASTVTDEWGDHDDWVEIYNAGAAAVNLGGLTLSDSWGNPTRYSFPDTLLPAESLLLVWCDGEPWEGIWHAEFKLSALGEELGLFHRAESGLTPLDTLSFGPLGSDLSLGRNPDGGPLWQLFDTPSPGWRNDSVGGPWQEPTDGLHLLGAWPNPSRAGSRIDFSLERPVEVRLRVFDIHGRMLAEIRKPALPAGTHGIDWNGRDEDGRTLAAGLYLYRLEGGGSWRDGKLVLLR